ncbi:MAG: histidinol-phosphate transaminase [Candidatus Micrarchaeia archaeon]
MEVSETVRRMNQYEWEVSSESIARKYGIPLTKIIRFDTNTSLFKPTFSFKRIELNEYPDPSYTNLRRMLGEYTGVPSDGIVVGAGADELLNIIARVVLEKGDKAVISSPTYPMFRVVVEGVGGVAYEVERREDFSLDEEILISKANEIKAKLVFVCNPNNPTGNLSGLREIEKIVSNIEGYVVVDEAYFEFCGRSSADLLGMYENLLIVRTFSKAFSLAGARVGYSLSSKQIAKLMNKVRMPNSVSSVSIFLAEESLKKRERMENNVKIIVSERERLAKQLKKLDLRVFPSYANFLLVKFKDARYVFNRLIRKGIVARKFSSKQLRDFLRFTVRSRRENSILVRELRGVLNE